MKRQEEFISVERERHAYAVNRLFAIPSVFPEEGGKEFLAEDQGDWKELRKKKDLG